jgi:hypothetical protein
MTALWHRIGFSLQTLCGDTRCRERDRDLRVCGRVQLGDELRSGSL